MQGISSKALSFGGPVNKEKTFQGQRFDDDLGLNWIQFKWRNHDPQIGRFIEIDPLSDKYEYNSIYAFSENKVTTHVELEGLEAEWFERQVERDLRDVSSGKITTKQLEQRVNARNAAGSFITTNVLPKVGIMALVVLQPEIGIPLAVSDLSGVPVTPSPKVMSGTILSEASTIETTTTEFSAASKGVDLSVKAKPTWNANQIAQAEGKVDALTNAETVVTKNPVARDANLRSKFKAAGGQVSSTQHVDHIVDLQLGGTNATSNLQALDASVNTSLGKQIQLQTRNLPDNTRVNRIILELPPKKQ